MEIYKLLSLAILIPLMFGCASNQVVRLSGDYPAKPENSVGILFSPPSQEHTVIGLVSVRARLLGSAYVTEEDMIIRLRKEAASVGADAVIVTRIGSKVIYTAPATLNTQTNVNAMGQYSGTGSMGMYSGTASAYSTSTYTPSQNIALPEAKGIAIRYTK